VPTSTTNPAVITSSAFGPYFIDHVKHNYLDFLPSINLTFDLPQNLFLRLSAAETMSRPDYSALGGTVSLTDLTLTGNGGNADLRPIKAAVYDAALEWYYAPSSLATVSIFYDDLQSYVAFGTHPGVFLDQLLSKPDPLNPNGPVIPVFKPYNISSPVNSSGQLEGVELQVQQPVGYGVGYYENRWLSARLAYTYRSAYFIGLDRSSIENEAGNGQLDASVNVNITKNISLSVDGLNLTNTLLKYYAANPTQVRAVYNNGTQVYAGVHVKF
jgi:iron complex outermembrane receptor protein